MGVTKNSMDKKYSIELSRYALKDISSEEVIVPDEDIFELPEKVLQFGSGMLLRGLPDYFIDKANRDGVFNGRIVIVKTTSNGDINAFTKQDNLYTLCKRGIVDGKNISENIISSSISRVLTAQNDWKTVLECAYNEQLKIIISNTTEVGIQLVAENINLSPPFSFPGKLLAFLYERFKAFNGNKESGFVIVPTELIPDNGKKLMGIVMELAEFNQLGHNFIEWLKECNHFCNSLVDRIVTGMPSEKIRDDLENELGYTDDLLTVSEVYGLWAIEGNDLIRNILSFSSANEGLEVQTDIHLHRELKLRLLNGTHTLSCGIAFLSGFNFVKNAMEDETMSRFIIDIMQNEIGPTISCRIDADPAVKELFITKVLDRFRNPHINHFWKSITLNYTSKMKMRCIPVLISFSKNNNGKAPSLFAFGFAAYLRFMKAVKKTDKGFWGEFDNNAYLIEDDMAEYFYHLWQESTVETIVNKVLCNTSIWGDDISLMPEFQATVTENLNFILKHGMKAALENTCIKKTLANE